MMKKIKLLPAKFKMAGLVLAILAYVVPVALGMMHIRPDLSSWKQDLSKTLLLLGLLLIAFTNEKVEDEFIATCRLKAMFWAFVFSVTFYLGNAVAPLLRIEMFSYSGFKVIFLQLVSYLIYFHLNIRGITRSHAE